jgi:hypothetical protein
MSTNMDLKEWLALLKKARDDKNKVCENLEDQIRFLQEELDEKSRPFNDQMTTIENEIRTLAIERGESFKCGHGAVSFRKGYPRVTYSAKSLDIICQRHPIVKDLIWHNRTETMVNPAVTIEIYG